MRTALMMMFLLMCVTSTAFGQCNNVPDGYASLSLEKVKIGDQDGMIEVGVDGNDGSIIPVRVPTDSKFALRLLSKEGTFETWEIGYICNGYKWIKIENYPLRIETKVRESNMTLPSWYEVQPGQGWLKIEQETGIDADSLKEWNNIGDRGPYIGEHFFTENPGEVIRRWEYLNADPAGINYMGIAYVDSLEKLYGDPLPGWVILLHHIDLMDVPEYVRQHWRSMVEASDGDTVCVYSHPDSALVVDGVIFGGCNSGSAVKIWPKTAFLWKDRVTGQTIYQQNALEYAPVDFEGKRYLLQQYLVCDNGAYKVVDLEYIGQTEAYSRPAMTTHHDVPDKPKKESPRRSREFNQHGVFWLDEAYYRGGDDELWGTYAGIEWMPRLRSSYSDRTLGLQDLMAVVRVEQAYSDHNHGGDYRLGLRGNVYGDDFGWSVYMEGGGWYNASQRTYVKKTPISPQFYHCEEQGAYVDGHGWHARLLGAMPNEGYFDLTYRQGTNLDLAWDIGLTFEPDWFYSNASYGLRQQQDQSRNIDGQTHTFCADTIDVVQVRLGVKPSQKWLVFGSYEWWKYDSDAWDFRWEGPGAGLEYRPDQKWRFKASYRFLPDGKDYNRIAGLTYVTDRHWFKVGLVRSW